MECVTTAAHTFLTPPTGAHREGVPVVVGLHRPVEQLARGDDVRAVQPQPRQAALDDPTETWLFAGMV
jgi:hypothetical protein